MDILERYPGRYDVLDFYGRKFAEEFRGLESRTR